MKSMLARALVLLTVTFSLALIPEQAKAAQCSTAETAGEWAYTYNGTIFTPSGALPTGSVGHYQQDSAGNITGSQTRSVAGASGVEEIAGTVSVNKDCTAVATINVFENGQLQRTAVIALVFDRDKNHARMIFQSLTLPNGANVPVVLTVDASRITTKD